MSSSEAQTEAPKLRLCEPSAPESEPAKQPADLAIRKRLAVNIRRLAARKGLSTTALARKSGASRTQLYNMQRYLCSPTTETLYLVACALEVDIAELMAPNELG